MKYFNFTSAMLAVFFLAGCGNSSNNKKEADMKLEEGEAIAHKIIEVVPEKMATYHDVVCGMSLKNSPIVDTAMVDGRIYPFCAPECKKKFLADVGKYKVN